MFQKKILTLLLIFSAVVFIPTVAFAQTEDTVLYDSDTVDWDYIDSYNDNLNDISDAESAVDEFSTIFAVWGLIMIPVFLSAYIYTSLAYMEIAKKLNHSNPWYAWVPILRGIQRFQVVDMSGWFILLMLIYPINLILSIILLMKTFEKRGMDKYLGLLGLIPGANLVLIGILAWKKDDSTKTMVGK